LFARTSWDENATWVGYFDGHLQLFRDGKIETLRAGAATSPCTWRGRYPERERHRRQPAFAPMLKRYSY